MGRTSLQRIMLVEDEPDIQLIARLALEAIGGFTLAVCDSARHALEVAPSWSPDLIMLDVMMPGIDGVTTFKKMQENPQLAKVPIIFMTAKARSSEVIIYKEMGALGVVAKPFDPMTLAEKVKAIWDNRKV